MGNSLFLHTRVSSVFWLPDFSNNLWILLLLLYPLILLGSRHLFPIVMIFFLNIWKTLKGIFTGFLHRAYTVCKGQHQKDEINFLISCFTENGYNSQQLKEIVRSFEEKRSTNRTPVADNDEPSKIITLPWIPGLSPKLRKTYRSSV